MNPKQFPLILLSLFVILLTSTDSFAKSRRGRHSKLSIEISSTQEEYQVGEIADFDIQFKGRRSLRSYDMLSTYPNDNEEVTLTKINKKRYSFQSPTLENPGEETLTVSLFRKGTLKQIKHLQNQLVCLEYHLAYIRCLMQHFPCFRFFLKRHERFLMHLIRIIEAKIDRLSIPKATASKTITVIAGDVTPPVISLLDNISVEATGPQTEVALPVPKVTDDQDPNPTVTNDAPAVYPLGSTTVTWTATDQAGNSSSLSIQVTIQDTTPPILPAIENILVEAQDVETEVTLPTLEAEDLVDGTLSITYTDTLEGYPLGSTEITATATDNQGNSSSTTFQVIVSDTTAPALTLNTPPQGFSTVEESISVSGTVSDIFFQTLTINGVPVTPSTDGSFQYAQVLAMGENQIEVLATDSSGNTTTGSRTGSRIEPPTMNILHPEEGSVFDLPMTHIKIEWAQGTLPLNIESAQFLVNSEDWTEQFEVTEEGAFFENTQKNPLANGTYDLEAKVADIQGNEVTLTRSFQIQVTNVLPLPEVNEEEDHFIIGQVINSRTGTPISGAKVTLNEDQSSAVYTNSQGYYSFPLQPLPREIPILIEKDGYSYSIKRVLVSEYEPLVSVETATLVPIDPAFTMIGSEGGTYQHSQGLIEMTFPAGAVPEGTTIKAQSIWYEKGEEIPGKLPPTSMFTYCIELLPDGMTFPEPIAVRHKNTRGFAPGQEIPVGFYDRTKTMWFHETMAQVDPTGEWVEFQVTHFSPHDINFPGNFVVPETKPVIKEVNSKDIVGGGGETLEIPIGPNNLFPTPSIITKGKRRAHPENSHVDLSTGSYQLSKQLFKETHGAFPVNLTLNYDSSTVAPSKIFSITSDNSGLTKTNTINHISNEYHLLRHREKKFYQASDKEQTTRINVKFEKENVYRTPFDTEILKKETEALESGSYVITINHKTNINVQYFSVEYFGGPPVDPLEIWTDVDIEQPIKALVPINSRGNSEFGKGWSLNLKKKLNFRVPGIMTLEEGNGLTSFLPDPNNFDVSKFVFLKERYNDTSFIRFIDFSGQDIYQEEIRPFENEDDYTLSVVDINSDGYNDLCFLSHQTGEIKFYLNTHPSTNNNTTLNANDLNIFQEKTVTFSGEINDYPSFWHHAYTCDYDGDGNEDIIATSAQDTYGDGAFYVIFGKSSPVDGVLNFNTKLLLFQNQRIIKHGDFNGDGKTDLIGELWDGDLRRYYIFKQGEDLLLHQTQEIAEGADYIRDIHVADINNDKRDDLVVNMKTIDTSGGYGGGMMVRALGVIPGGGDEGDGGPYPMMYTNSHEVRVFINKDGIIPSKPAPLFRDPEATGNCAVGDFNDDGNIDIVTFSFNPNYYETTVRFFKGHRFGRGGAEPEPTEEEPNPIYRPFHEELVEKEGTLWDYTEKKFQLMDATDYNNDGIMDVVAQNQDSINFILGDDTGSFEGGAFRYLGGSTLSKLGLIRSLNSKARRNTYLGQGGDKSKIIYTPTDTYPYMRLLPGGAREFYSATGKLKEIKDPSGNIMVFNYHDGNLLSKDLIKSIVFPDNEQIDFHYTPDGITQRITSTSGSEVNFNHTENSLKSIVLADNSISSFKYNDKGLMVENTDQKDRIEKYTFENKNILREKYYPTRKVIDVNEDGSQTSPLEKDKKVNYFSQALKGVPFEENEGTINNLYPVIQEDEIKTQVSVDGYTGEVTLDFNDYDSVVEVTDELGQITRFDRDNKNNITKIIKPNLAEYSMVYDEYNNLVSKKDEQINAEYKYEYEDKFQLLKRITNTKFQSYEFSYLNEGMPNMEPLLTRIQDPLGQTITYDYQDFGNYKNLLRRKTDRRGNSVIYDYNNDGMLTSVKADVTRVDENGTSHSETVEVKMDYDTKGNLIWMEDPRGNEYRYEYDNMNRPTKTIHPDLSETLTSYNKAGEVTQVIDRDGKETNFEYNGAGLLEKVIDHEGNETKYYYNGKGRISVIEDPRGNQQKFYFNEKGQITRLWNADNKLTEYEYTENGKIKEIRKYPFASPGVMTGTDVKWTFNYDDSDRLTSMIYPGPQLTRPNIYFEYDKEGNYDKIRRNAQDSGLGGTVFDFTYDALQRMKKVTLPDSSTINYNYDGNNNITSERGRTNKTYRYEFDELNRLTDVFNPLDIKTAHYQFDLASNVIANTNALGRTSKYEYDQNDRLRKLIDAKLQETLYEYSDQGDLLAEVDRNGIRTEYQYTNLHQLQKMTENALAALEEDKRITQYEYDPAGNLEAILDGNDNRTEYTYDSMNRVETHTLPDGKVYSYDYTSYGYLKDYTTPMGTISYTYDDRGNRTSKSYTGENSTYSFDSFDRITSASNGVCNTTYEWTITSELDKITHVIGGQTYEIDNVWDKGRLESFSSPGGNTTLSYDNADRLQTIQSPLGAFTYTYSDLNEVLSKSRPNGITESNIFDELSRLVGIANILGTNNKLSFDYEYDAVGNKLREVKSFDNTLGVTQAEGKLYNYDDLYRLRGIKKYDPSAYVTPPSFDEALTFKELTTVDLDILGNRKTVKTIDPLGVVFNETRYNSQSGNYVADPTNKIAHIKKLSSTLPEENYNLAHDDNGNITDDGKFQYIFDMENKLREVKDKTTNGTIAIYNYDAQNRRVQKQVNGQDIHYVHSGDQILQERNISSGQVSTYSYGLGLDDINAVDINGATYYPITNDQGSVFALTDGSGNIIQRFDYDSFGKVTVQDDDGSEVTDSPLTTRLFQGRDYDLESGLYYFRARYYSPTLGRFISHDPMDYVDGMNMYEFVSENPTSYTDPMGLEKMRVNDDVYDVVNEEIKSVQKGAGRQFSGVQDKSIELFTNGSGNNNSHSQSSGDDDLGRQISSGSGGEGDIGNGSGNNDKLNIGEGKGGGQIEYTKLGIDTVKKTLITTGGATGGTIGFGQPTYMMTPNGGVAAIGMGMSMNTGTTEIPIQASTGNDNNDDDDKVSGGNGTKQGKGQNQKSGNKLSTYLNNKMRRIYNQIAAGGMRSISGTVSVKDALKLGKKFVGEGFTYMSNNKGILSKDRLRQFRFPSKKGGVNPNTMKPYSQTGMQVNFQSREIPSGRFINNVHLDIE